MEGKNPIENKGLVVKWRRGRRPIATCSDSIYRKNNSKTCERYIHRKGKHKHGNLLFKH